MSNKPSIEREFEAFLNGEDNEIARIYRKLPPAEPDRHLDAAVLAMGRGAVEPQRRAAIRHARAQHRLPAWMVGIGSAAGIVFAAGLAWQLRSSINPAPGAAMRTTDNSADVINVTILPPREPKGAPVPPLPEPAGKVAAATPPSPPAMAAPKLERADAETTGFVKQEAQGVTEYTLPSGAAGRRPQPAPFVRDQAKSQGSAAGGKGDQYAEPQPEEGADNAADDKASDAYEPEQQPGYRGAPRSEELTRRRELAAAAKEKRSTGVRDNETADMAQRSKNESAAAAPAAPSRLEDKKIASGKAADEKDRLLPVNSAGLQRNAKLPPAKWLEKIQELLKQGKHDEAVDNAQYFRAKYPNYALPDAIRQLADEER